MARQNNYPIFENNSTVITAEFLNGLVNNVKTLNQEDGVFDISIANAVSGVPTTYNSLELALSGTNIPVDIRKGGMGVKFINSGTGKYEQWNLKTSSWSIDTSDWALDVDGSVTDGKLKLPFELEKPSLNEFVTQAENISYGGGDVKAELDKINLKEELLDFFKECDEQGFYIVDENGYINTAISSSKFDTSDIGTALTTIITNLIAEYAPTPTSEFLEVEEAGFYIVDSAYKIGAYLNSTGIPYGFAQHDYAYSVIGTSDYDVA